MLISPRMIILKSSSLRCSIFQTRHINWKSWRSRNREKVLRLEKLSSEEIWLRRRKIIIQHCKIMIRRIEVNEWRWTKKEKLSVLSPRCVERRNGVISWYCGHDKRKRIVYTHERWTIIRTIDRRRRSVAEEDTRKDCTHFLHFLWNFSYAYDPRMNRVWIFIIKEDRLSFSSIEIFFFQFFRHSRGERFLEELEYWTWIHK